MRELTNRKKYFHEREWNIFTRTMNVNNVRICTAIKCKCFSRQAFSWVSVMALPRRFSYYNWKIVILWWLASQESSWNDHLTKLMYLIPFHRSLRKMLNGNAIIYMPCVSVSSPRNLFYFHKFSWLFYHKEKKKPSRSFSIKIHSSLTHSESSRQDSKYHYTRIE